MKVGSTVRIVEDEYEDLVGFIGEVLEFSLDGTAALVSGGVAFWCSVCNLEEV
jgi:hypothetical protein